MISVAIVEDRRDVREGLRDLLSGHEGFAVVGAFERAEDLLDFLEAGEVFPIVLMDIELPGISGIEATRVARERWPQTQIMMLTVYGDDDRIFESLRAGATGYVLKTTPAEKLLDNIRLIHAGGSPMSSAIARKVVETFHQPKPKKRRVEGLTPREEEILALLAEGYRYREIATTLFISLDTVRTHIRHIYEKMQVRSRTEAAVKYLEG